MDKPRSYCREAAEPAPAATRRLADEFEGREASMPRERLVELGAGALSDAELVAILLRSGTRGHNVLSVAREILRLHGDDLSLLARATAADLRRVPGVGKVRALEFEAAFELCRRILRASSRASRPVLDTPERLVRHLWPLAAMRETEAFFACPLDKKMRLCAGVRHVDACVGTGSADSVPVHPRDVYREAAKADACYVVVAHNHPTGDPTPSPQDLLVTRRLVDAGRAVGIPLVDSVVIGGLPASGGAFDPFDPASPLPRFVSLRRSGAVDFD